MKRIILFGTDHIENGKCNVIELYDILLKIKPDIIFEEIPIKMFSDIYNEHKYFDTLEVSSVRKYLEKYFVRHIPVDIEKHDKTIIDYDEEKISNHKIKKIQEYINDNTKEKGFLWINTKEHDELIEKKYELHKKHFTYDENNLLNEYERSYNYHFETREEIFLNNISNYTEEYSNGIFLIGGDHRPTLISKIKRLRKNKRTEIKWEYYWGNDM
jgi:hypothetical protein